MKAREIVFWILASALSLASARSPGPLTIEVAAGNVDRDGSPVIASLPEAPPDAIAYAVRSLKTGKTAPGQRVSGTNAVAWIPAEPISAGSSERFEISASDSAPAPGVRSLEDDDSISVFRGSLPVLRYQKAVRESPEGIDPVYRRSGYIHPVYNSAGQEITGDFAPDHAHQHALFFAWTNTTFEGRSVDFWNQSKQHGRIAHVSVKERFDGPVFSQFTVLLEHSDRTAPGGVKPVLEESWTVRVYSVSGDVFLFDLESIQKCASDSPLILNEYRYGGMSLRGNVQWMDESVEKELNAWEKKRRDDPDLPRPDVPLARDFLTSEGMTGADGNHTGARWVDMFGKIDGASTGIAVLSHPENYRAPQKVRLHPSKPYFCFAPMADGEFRIVPGTPYVSRYRYLVHLGEPDADFIERQWRQFAEPAAVIEVK